MTKTFRDRISTLHEKTQQGPISIGELLHILSGKGRCILILFLTIPFCLPIQIPGLSTPFGIIIALLGLRHSFGNHIWMPKFLLAKTLSPRMLHKITRSALYLTTKIEKLIHPRLLWLSTPPTMRFLNGLLIAFLGLVLALPLPVPLTNLAAAWALFFLAFGVLEDDGLFILISYLITLISTLFFGWLLEMAREQFFS